jgi:hypothetical protein
VPCTSVLWLKLKHRNLVLDFLTSYLGDNISFFKRRFTKSLSKILSKVVLVVTFSLSTYVNAGDFGDLKLQVDLEGYQYEVIWHIDLDTFYMNLREGSIQRAFSTARIPTENHNNTGLDVTFLDGHRRFISCAFK